MRASCAPGPREDFSVTYARAIGLYIWDTPREEPGLKSRGKEPDERLLVEAAQQDPGRFAELYEIYFDRVYAYIARRVRDRSDPARTSGRA